MRRRLGPTVLALGALGFSGLAPAAADEPDAGTAAAEEKPLDGDAIPVEKSKPPKVTEWSAAPRVKLTRKGPAAASCQALLLREWLRLRCEGPVFALSLLGGSPESIAFWIGGSAEEPFGELLMPLRRGDRRVFQLWTPGKDAAGAFVAKPMLVVQEQWALGQKTPIVTAW